MTSGGSGPVRASLADPARFEEVFRGHHRRIWRYLARRGGRTVADDLAGEVFVRAFAGRDRYDAERGSVEAWLYGIAANLLRTHFRTEERSARALARVLGVRRCEPGFGPAADGPAIDRDELARVLDALPRLPGPDREVLLLFVWEHLTYEDIAATLGVEVGTVRSRLSRARARLRELAGLAGELHENRTARTGSCTDG